jgi:hypothetical protein
MNLTNPIEEIQNMSVDEIELHAQIPKSISLRRIKRKTLARVQPQSGRFAVRKTVLVPVFLLMLLLTVGVYAYSSNLWGLFYKNSDKVISNESYPEQSVESEGIKITVHQAAFGDYNGMVILSLENTDGSTLDFNTLPHFTVPSGLGGYTVYDMRELSDDGKTMHYCVMIRSTGGKLTSAPLNFSIPQIDFYETSTPHADFSVADLLSDQYQDILSVQKDSRKVAILSTHDLITFRNQVIDKGDIQWVEEVEGFGVLTAGYVDDQLNIVFERRRDGDFSAWLAGLYDTRSGNMLMQADSCEMGEIGGNTVVEMSYFSDIPREELPYLIPVITKLKKNTSVKGDWQFMLDTTRTLDEIEITEGLNAPGIPGVIECQKLNLSTIGVGLNLTSKSLQAIDILLENDGSTDSYCVMEDGSRIVLYPNSGGSTSMAPDNTLFALDVIFTSRDYVIATDEVAEIWIRNELIWRK